MVILFFIFSLILSMIMFSNPLYYSIALVIFVVSTMFFMVTSNILPSLTMLMLCIVYVGAMMILIGYVCAVCPNLKTNSYFYDSKFMFLFFSLSFLFLSMTQNSYSYSSPSLSSLSEYFYSSFGLPVFLFLIFFLFITLLMVTSQSVSPKGPFRSI